MNVLTAEQMREADRRMIAAGTPGEVLMERARTRVVEVLAMNTHMRVRQVGQKLYIYLETTSPNGLRISRFLGVIKLRKFR